MDPTLEDSSVSSPSSSPSTATCPPTANKKMKASHTVKRRLRERRTFPCPRMLCPPNHCYCCRQPPPQPRLIPFNYVREGLELSADTADCLRRVAHKKSLQMKKLVLLLDLDHTLLHSSSRRRPTQPDDPADLIDVESVGRIVKLRPGVHEFLKSAAKLFDMYIYTMGGRLYAEEMAKILDPDDEYFAGGQRVISRSDSTDPKKKGLDVVLASPSTVVVVDDTEEVWSNHSDNLIQIEEYNYRGFSGREHRNKNEDEDRHLRTVSSKLRWVHAVFFNGGGSEDRSTRDVRNVLRNMQRGVLRGCNVAVFGGYADNRKLEKYVELRAMAERMGAAWSTTVETETTHVIKSKHWKMEDDEKKWVVGNGKKLVNSGWLKSAYYAWRRPDESDFTVHVDYDDVDKSDFSASWRIFVCY